MAVTHGQHFIDAEVAGAGNVAAKFLDLAGAARTAVIRKGLRTSGNVVLKEARRRVTVETGNLRRSLKLDVRVRREGWGTARVFPRQGSDQRHDGFYGRFVELGTVHMPARPFLRPALDHSRRESEQAFAQALREEIEKRIERARL